MHELPKNYNLSERYNVSQRAANEKNDGGINGKTKEETKTQN